jgi:hypothetical protein
VRIIVHPFEKIIGNNSLETARKIMRIKIIGNNSLETARKIMRIEK